MVDCLGNICRSPLAQGVFEALVKQEGLQDRIIIGSAGTSHWHVGGPPDPRMQQTARQHGIHLNSRARQFQAADFKRMELVLAMDQSNLNVLQQMRPEADPYYGGDKGFETVFQMIERTCPKVLQHLQTKLAKKA